MKTFADVEILLRFAYQDDNGRRFSADTWSAPYDDDGNGNDKPLTINDKRYSVPVIVPVFNVEGV